MSLQTPIVALVGNPNAGKTSLFNSLTGSSQKVGNYPGVTVERVSANIPLGNFHTVEFVDIPGLYSLNAISEDERVAVESIVGMQQQRPTVFLCVIDATTLERNLFLYSHLADHGLPMVVALTKVDTARSAGVEIKIEALETALGVPVIPVVSHKGEGLAALREALESAILRPQATPPVGREPGADVTLSIEERYMWANSVKEVAYKEGPKKKTRSTSEKIDFVLTHRVFGLVVFAALMYVVFQSIYTFSGPLMDGIETSFGWLGERVSGLLSGNEVLRSLVVDGVITGIGSVLVFLPQIVILFFFIAFLEGTGYMARAAFLMDKLLGWCGLNGRAFIPLLSSFACAIPGIMAARVMPDQKSRLATILVAPLMSCSARLPVYVVLIGAFIEPQFGAAWAGFALFAMHMVGLVVAVPIVFLLNRRVLRGRRLPFVMELPRYQWPKWRDIWLTMWIKGKSFVQTAGKIILVMSVIIWALLYFPRSSEQEARFVAEYNSSTKVDRSHVTEEMYVQRRHTEESYLGQFGRFIEPVFVPAGFDWRISTAILSAFPAREVVVSAIGILFDEGADPDEKNVIESMRRATWPDGRPLFTPWTAVGLMVFFALCCQCMATLATIRRETNSVKYPIFVFVYMTGLAYVSAVLINYVGKWLGN